MKQILLAQQTALIVTALMLSACQSFLRPKTAAAPRSMPSTAIASSVASSSPIALTDAQNVPTSTLQTARDITQDITQETVQETPQAQLAILPPNFRATGKLGFSAPQNDGKRTGGSAFYAWAQDGARFAIDVSGALGLGTINIRFDGQTATLTADGKTQTAQSPEALLARATGIAAPIGVLPFWLAGVASPSDTHTQFDANGRLVAAQNDDWLVQITHNGNTKLLLLTDESGKKVTLTAVFQQ